MKRVLKTLVFLMLLALPVSGPALAQTEAEHVEALWERFSDKAIVYGGDYAIGVAPCTVQRERALAAIESFVTNPRVEAAVFSQWQWGRGGSYSGRRNHEARGIFLRQLIDLHAGLSGVGASTGCPPRGEIRGLALSLRAIALRHAFLYEDLSESPIDIVGYLVWRGRVTEPEP